MAKKRDEKKVDAADREAAERRIPDEATEPQSGEKPAPSETPSKKRGRPKGSKNKPRHTAPVLDIPARVLGLPFYALFEIAAQRLDAPYFSLEKEEVEQLGVASKAVLDKHLGGILALWGEEIALAILLLSASTPRLMRYAAESGGVEKGGPKKDVPDLNTLGNDASLGRTPQYGPVENEQARPVP